MKYTIAAIGILALSFSPSFAQNGRGSDRVAKEVRHELVMLPYYNVFDNLAFKVDGSTVTLMGQVARPTLKSDAENVVKRVEGVSQVNNQIEVLPLSPMDMTRSTRWDLSCIAIGRSSNSSSPSMAT